MTEGRSKEEQKPAQALKQKAGRRKNRSRPKLNDRRQVEGRTEAGSSFMTEAGSRFWNRRSAQKETVARPRFGQKHGTRISVEAVVKKRRSVIGKYRLVIGKYRLVIVK